MVAQSKTDWIKYPWKWEVESIDKLNNLSLSQADVDAIEANLDRFRQIRDELAVKRYVEVYEDLKRQVAKLYAELHPLVDEQWAIMKMHKELRANYAKRLHFLDEEIRRVGELWADANNELAGIDNDYANRMKRLQEYYNHVD